MIDITHVHDRLCDLLVVEVDLESVRADVAVLHSDVAQVSRQFLTGICNRIFYLEA